MCKFFLLRLFLISTFSITALDNSFSREKGPYTQMPDSSGSEDEGPETPLTRKRPDVDTRGLVPTNPSHGTPGAAATPSEPSVPAKK